MRTGGGGTTPAYPESRRAMPNAYAAKTRKTNHACADPTQGAAGEAVRSALERAGGGLGGRRRTDGKAALGSIPPRRAIFGIAVGADYRFSPFTIAGLRWPAAAPASASTASAPDVPTCSRPACFTAAPFVRPIFRRTGLWLAGYHDRSHRHHRRHRSPARAVQRQRTWSGRAEAGYRFVAPDAAASASRRSTPPGQPSPP